MDNTRHSDELRQVTLFTHQREPLLEGPRRAFAEAALKNLSKRYPGLILVRYAIEPDRVDMTLDFQRLDEDVQRVVLSFKSEVKNLSRKKGLPEIPLWSWEYMDQEARENPS